MSFTDPVVRCTECQKLIYRDEVQQFGRCPECGCARVRNVMSISVPEKEDLQRRGHQSFVDLFEGSI